MKKLIILIFTINSMFGNFAWAQDNGHTYSQYSIRDSLKALQEIEDKLRFLDYQRKEIRLQEAIDKISKGEPVYLINRAGSPGYLRISMNRPFGSQLSSTLLVEEIVGTDVAASTILDLQVDEEAIPTIYKKLFGLSATEQATDTNYKAMKGGDLIYNSKGVVVACKDGHDAITGKPLKTVTLGIGPGNIGNLFFVFVLPILSLWAMHPKRTTGKGARVGLYIIAGISLIYLLTSAALYKAGSDTGCK